MKNYGLTRLEWLRLLNAVWGNCKALTEGDIAAIGAVAEPGESSMATCARLAGVDVTGVQPFDHAHVRSLCARRELELSGHDASGQKEQ